VVIAVAEAGRLVGGGRATGLLRRIRARRGLAALRPARSAAL